MENSAETEKNRQTKIYKFGDFYLDPIERKVFKDRSPLEINSKAFDILRFLVEKHGEIVTKDEILGKVWDGSFVEEGNLSVHIFKIRRILESTKSEPIIETVPGSGYRFVSRVYTLDEEEWQNYLQENPSDTKLDVEEEFDSIAVIPLKNKNGDEEVDYLADGITENIIYNLSHIPNLRVLARNTVFRYKNKDIDIQKVGKTLGVAKILTGRIRVIRDSLNITVELTDTENGSQLWGKQFYQPFEDIFEIQDKIAQSVFDNLKSHVNKVNVNALLPQLTNNSESYRLYLKGKYLWEKKSIKDINKAIEYFQLSIAHDPTNVYSYTTLADSYRMLHSYEQITYKQALNQIYPLFMKAIELNPLVSEVYVFKGIFELFFEFDFNKAEKNFKRALELNPNSVEAHYRYSKLLVFSRRFSESLKHIKEYAKLEPLSLVSYKNIGRLFYFMEQYENSVFKLEECLELETEDFLTHLLLGINLTELGEYNKAFQAYQKSLILQNHPETISMIGYTKALSGERNESEKSICQLDKISRKRQISPTYYAIIYSALEETDKAFEKLEKAFKEQAPDIIALNCDPRWKNLRNDPRFNKMLLKIGLPIK